MSEADLKEKDWKELTLGIKNTGDFLREFKDGIKGVIDSSKEKAKNQVAENIWDLFIPLRNTITDVMNQLSGDLGLHETLNKLDNKLIEFINAFARFITKYLGLIGRLGEGNESYKNLLAWMELLGNPFTYGRIGWFWGVLLPPGLPASGPIEIIED